MDDPNEILSSVRFQPLGACDYLEMGRVFDTVFIRNVPLLTLTLKDQARRFTTLIDNFYDQKVCSMFAFIIPGRLCGPF